MTDIRQHLAMITTCIRHHLARSDDVESIQVALREQLPASYGIGSGCLQHTCEGPQSQPFDIIIYDKTLSVAKSESGASVPPFYLRSTLVVIKLAYELDTDELRHLLQSIASARQLCPLPKPEPVQNPHKRHPKESIQATKKPASSLKKLLPLGIVAFQRLTDVQAPDPEQLSLTLDALLKEQVEDQRPDYLLALTHQLSYQNPLCSGKPILPTTINVQREPALQKQRTCYVCKQRFTHAHFHYQHLCLPCGDLNYLKRAIPANLTGRVALVTGGRLKIGYATALRLLRAGAQVIVTTRFPHDAAQRYSNEPDFTDWQDRLQIYGLDFRSLPVLEHFISHLYKSYSNLDILINNAAQTVRHPLDYYAHLLPFEQVALTTLTPAQQLLVQQTHSVLPATLFAMPRQDEQPLLGDQTLEPATSALLLHNHGADATLLPSTIFAQSLTNTEVQADLQSRNSWTLPLDEIDLTEFLEVQVINVTAPFLLVSRLRPLLRSSPFPQRFIVNVSAIEGQFANAKFGTHVHTNMAKAALNMLTHTAAADLAREHIFMYSVDPGWISQQAPPSARHTAEKLQGLLPLDLVDAAARICDPIFMGITTGQTSSGQFYKDYHLTAW